ncbi:MAG: hypothetical protein Athens071426_186 [Parcubacteria group bacterium Athens0714_26]|nr:MAG: hypothetical protein Athens101426_412 [Parcubacteria group bacterium Athens1014_26]TSD03589.1 MAG: hypothetical protein Athens071426_186 [Parcubacteria group bacterium Athens0714_26]
MVKFYYDNKQTKIFFIVCRNRGGYVYSLRFICGNFS